MLIRKASLQFEEELTPLTKIEKIILHHSEIENMDVNSIHEYHKEKHGWSGIGYNYYIDKNGDIFEGRGMNVGAHAKGYNAKSLGICLAGNFDLYPPATEQIDSAVTLVSNLLYDNELQVNCVVGHREINSARTCPGLFFDIDVFKDKVRKLEG